MVTMLLQKPASTSLLSEQASKAVGLINSYPFDQVKKKMMMEGTIPEGQIDEAIEEFRKYLKLIAMGHTEVAMISPVVDEVWHAFILFTRDYATFCQKTFGFSCTMFPTSPATR